MPETLPQLPPSRALGTYELPLRLNWSDPGRSFDLRNRADRARLYEIVIREGDSSDIEKYIDGTLLVDLWGDLVVPRELRELWAPVVSAAAGDAER